MDDHPEALDRPADLDASRLAISTRGLVGAASQHLTNDVAMALPFETLGSFKTLLKRFFSSAPWTARDEAELAALVAPHLDSGWWNHDLGSGLHLAYGTPGDHFMLWATGSSAAPASLFDRVFSGPVVPEATPHPRKVKFATGGTPAPGRWFQRSDPEAPDDAGVARLLEEPDITDVMVAGDFVTVGLERRSRWEDRLDSILELIIQLFWTGQSHEAGERTRDELLQEARGARGRSADLELHLLDPDHPEARRRLFGAMTSADARLRRIATAVLAESTDSTLRTEVLRRAVADDSRLVRRTAVDSAADLQDPTLRDLFEQTLSDEDSWIRWKAVRAIGDLGVAPSRDQVKPLETDPDFTVRFEVARVLRGTE